MLRHYLTIAFRQVRLEFGYVILNVLGLSAGLASAVLSWLYIQDELAYDQYGNGDRIYKLLRRQQLEGQDPVLRDGTSGLLGPTLKSEFAEVEEFIRVLNSGGWFDHEGKSLRGRLCSADPAILDMFDLRLVRGERPTPADGSTLVTESAALRFFGSEDPIGKVVSSQEQLDGGNLFDCRHCRGSPSAELRPWFLRFPDVDAARQSIRVVLGSLGPGLSVRPVDFRAAQPGRFGRLSSGKASLSGFPPCGSGVREQEQPAAAAVLENLPVSQRRFRAARIRPDPGRPPVRGHSRIRAAAGLHQLHEPGDRQSQRAAPGRSVCARPWAPRAGG